MNMCIHSQKPGSAQAKHEARLRIRFGSASNSTVGDRNEERQLSVMVRADPAFGHDPVWGLQATALGASVASSA